MKYYRLKNKETNWGDYGGILLTGMTGHLERENDLLQLERTGPFQPDIIISCGQDLLVTDSLKNKLQNSGLTAFEFKPVIKKHISFVDWTVWDLQAESPKFYPEDGEPENYILSHPHAENVAEKMENVWEVLASEGGKFNTNGIFIKGVKALDILKAENRGWYIVTEKMKIWLEQNAAAWLCFEEVELENK